MSILSHVRNANIVIRNQTNKGLFNDLSSIALKVPINRYITFDLMFDELPHDRPIILTHIPYGGVNGLPNDYIAIIFEVNNLIGTI